ncbi:MAG TPA: GtrA family protein [Anaerolineae bacterium]
MTRLFHQVNSLAPDWLKGQPIEIRRFIKFFIVGGFGAVVDFTVLNLLVLFVGMPKVYANIISVSFAIISNFTWNRLWTFPESREHAVHHQFIQFALVNLVGLAINTGVFLLTDQYIWLPTLPNHPTIALNLAKACAIGVVLFWNFGANRLWTYRHIK